ncbi:hypothetical protein ACWCYK_34165 [Streptomyces lydicamycinicus]
MGVVRQVGFGEFAAGAFEALSADPGGDGGLFVLEEAVEVAGGDVVRGCDHRGPQVRVGQISMNEGLDAQDQSASVGFGPYVVAGFQVVGESGGEQVQGHRAQPSGVCGLVVRGVSGQAHEELREQAADSFPAG